MLVCLPLLGFVFHFRIVPGPSLFDLFRSRAVCFWLLEFLLVLRLRLVFELLEFQLVLQLVLVLPLFVLELGFEMVQR